MDSRLLSPGGLYEGGTALNCPVCEDTGKVAPSKPVVVEIAGVEAQFSKWVPCPVCPAGVRFELEAIRLVEKLKELQD